MIGNITFNNYRFFANNQTLSLFPDMRTKKLLANSILISEKNVLKSTAIYGSNNSGKSSIVNLFQFIKDVLLGKENVCFNSKRLGDKPNIDISITFNNTDNNGWYKYSFSYDHENKRFDKEALYSITFYSDGAPLESTIFEKNINNQLLKISGVDHSNLIDVISSRKPLLYTLNLEQGTFRPLYDYLNKLINLANSIIVFKMFNIPIENTVEALKGTNEDKKKFIIGFVKNADLSIENFEYSEKALVLLEKTENVDENVLKQRSHIEEMLHLTTKYAHGVVPSILFDSSGTKKIQAIASYIYDAIHDGKTLIIDELDSGLHYKLTRAIVSTFNNYANRTGQLIFTAHDLLLVGNNNLMRKDQIYFISRDKNQALLKWMKDLTIVNGGPREVEALIKRYNHGDFVKVPAPSFIEDILGIALKGHDNGN